MPERTSCAAPCPINRARFLQSSAIAALPELAASAGITEPAFAQTIGSIAPLKSQGKTLTYAIPPKDGALIDDANGVIVARLKNAVYAFSIVCPHRSTTSLEWLADEHVFHCPRHDAHFAANGQLIDGRPDRAMDRYAIRRSGQTIVVDTASVFQQDTDQAAWGHAVAALT